MKRKHKSTQ